MKREIEEDDNSLAPELPAVATKVLRLNPVVADIEAPSTAPAAPAAAIRVRTNLMGSSPAVQTPVIASVCPAPASAAAPTSAAGSGLSSEVIRLREEVRALQWLARRKEQEWDQTIALLKAKEEKLVKAEKKKAVAAAEAAHKMNVMKEAANAAPVKVMINGGGVVTSTSTGSSSGGRRILIPAGQITPAQLKAIKEGKTVFKERMRDGGWIERMGVLTFIGMSEIFCLS